MVEKFGVLPMQRLGELISAGFLPAGKINPASLDLPLGEEAYRLEYGILPKENEKVRTLLKRIGARPHDLRIPLEVGVPYLVLVGKLGLPKKVKGYANPKSSTGRINLLARLVADNVAMYDALVPEGWEGEAWVLLRARSFPVLITPGQAVSQLRLFYGTSFLDDMEMEIAIEKYGLLFHPDGRKYSRDQHQQQGSALLLSLGSFSGVVGWECRGTKRVLDFGKIRHYHPSEFFTPVVADDDAIVLREGSFYILSTLQRISVPPVYSAELRAIDPRFAEARIHSAGYVDPGWGYGEKGEVKGRPITLEVIMFEDDRWSCGRNIARIRYERMWEEPHIAYDQAKSHYTTQDGATLSKHFVEQ